ncbi:MAG: TolC family protein [Rhodocyclaceae bacterium]|nr:TolC family protein [Rhodocyclaceae bacterium]
MTTPSPALPSARCTPFRARRLSLLVGALILAGCASVDPVPLDEGTIKSQAKTDRDVAQRDVEPVAGAISLEEAIARGLKYNLDRRARMMEEAIAFNQLDVSKYDMLPKLVASAGYRSRSEFATSSSIDSVTGLPSLANPSISSDKDHATSDLGLTWNLLDFGLSYSTAKQNADRALIAVERRRKAMHILVQDVRTAFWRTASAQKLRDDVKAAIGIAEDALADARKAEEERLRSPLDSLRYQRQVLENLRLLETIDQELSTARVELANLINVPLAVGLKVAEPGEALSKRMLELPIEAMEDVAIAKNADLREQFYNTRIASEETRKTLLRLFPSVSFNFNVKNDNDKFLVHNSWNEAGVQLSFGLLNLLSAPTQMRLAEAGIALADQRRVATQMAILAQMHIARLQYANAIQQYQRSDTIWKVDDRISRHTTNREQADAQSKLDKVANNTATILSQLRRYQALAQAHAAASRLQATLGMEPEIGSVQEMSLTELQTVIGAAIKQWENGELPGREKTAALASSELPAPSLMPAASLSAPPPRAVAVNDQAAKSAATPIAPAPVSAVSAPRQPVVEAKPAVATPERMAASTKWVVQLGAHHYADLAQELVRRASSLELPVFVETAEEGGAKLTKVLAGPFASRKKAKKAQVKLVGLGLHGFVRPL